MGKLNGIVTKISGDKCIIITKDGEFRRVPLPLSPIRVGQEIQVAVFEWPALSKYALIAASLLIVVFGLNLFLLSAAATPAAYVTLDINPSLEIAVDQAAKVVEVSALNPDAQPLLDKLDYQEQDIYTVLSLLLQRAIELNYVAPDRNNLVVSSVVEVNPQNVHLDTVRLETAVASPLKGKPLKASVVVYKANKQDREAARKVSLSTGKYLIYEGERKKGSNITLEEVKKQSLGALVETKKVKLPESRAEVIVEHLNREIQSEPGNSLPYPDGKPGGEQIGKAKPGKKEPGKKEPENSNGGKGRKPRKEKTADDREERAKENLRNKNNSIPSDEDRKKYRDEGTQKEQERKKTRDKREQKDQELDKDRDDSRKDQKLDHQQDDSHKDQERDNSTSDEGETKRTDETHPGNNYYFIGE